MTIRDKEKYIDNLWDWGFLDDCFGNTKIKVTDIDGAVERWGNFLIIETKLPGNEIPKGQQIMFDAMVNSGLFTIVYLWGENNQPRKMRVAGPQGDDLYTNISEEDVLNVVRSWFVYANKNRRYVRVFNTKPSSEPDIKHKPVHSPKCKCGCRDGYTSIDVSPIDK